MCVLHRCGNPSSLPIKLFPRARRARFILALGAGLVLGLMPARAAITVLDDWRMGEADPGAATGVAPTNLVDSVGGHNLKVAGAAQYSTNVSAAAAAHTGSFLSVNFTNSAYATNPIISTLTTNFGIEAWVNCPTVAGSTGGWIIAYNGNTGGNGWGFMMQNGIYEGLLGNVAYVGSALVTAGAWTHVALVNNNGVNTLYINGVAAGGGVNATAIVPSGNFGLATAPSAPGAQTFPGLVDEVRVFTFASSQFSTNDLLINEKPGVLLGTTNLVVGPGAGNGSVVVAVSPANYTWTASPNATWLHLSQTHFTGSDNLIFLYDANAGATRSGTLTIAGQTLTVTQAGSTYAPSHAVTALVSSSDALSHECATDGAGNVYTVDNNTAIVKWTATNNTLTTVFTNVNGFAGVAADAAGNLYFSTNGYLAGGAVRKWTAANGTFTTLVPASANSYPGGVAVDGAGNAYIIDSGYAMVIKWIAASNTYSTLIPPGLPSPQSLAVDAAGNIYITCANTNTVLKWVAATGSLTNLVPATAGLNFPTGVAVDGSGNVYIADLQGGDIREWSAATGTLITLTNGLNDPEGVAADGAGNVYFSDGHYAALNERVNAWVDTTAKSEGPSAGADALPTVLPATENLLPPFAPTTDVPWLTITGVTNGVVHFAFAANLTLSNRAGHISVFGQPVTVTQTAPQYTLGATNLLMGPAGGSNTVALGVAPVAGNWTATANNGWLHLITGSGAGSTNILFTCDTNSGVTRIGSLTIAGQTVTVTQAGTNYVATPSVITLSTNTMFPQLMAADPAGNVYFADGSSGSGSIKKWTLTNNLVTPLYSGLTGNCGVAVDGAGNVYFTDDPAIGIAPGKLLKWTATNGTVTVLYSSTLIGPSALQVDSAGNVYFLDRGSGTIYQWIAASNTVTAITTPGAAGLPSAFAMDVAGNLYITCTNNTLLKWVAASGSLTTLVSSGMSRPVGVAVDGSGNVYWANVNGGRIAEWSAATKGVTILTNIFSVPWGVAVDSTGNVYIADFGHNTIAEQPHAWVNTTTLLESQHAGTGALPPVLPVTENLLAPFVPTSDEGWLTIGTVTNGVVNFSVAANAGMNRIGLINVLGQAIAVSQEAVLSYTLGTAQVIAGPAGGTYSITLAVSQPAAAWTATGDTNDSSWLHVSPGSLSGTGSTNVFFSCDANTGFFNRAGTLLIGDQTLTVIQVGLGYVTAQPPTVLSAVSPLNQPVGLGVDSAGNVYTADYGASGIFKWTLTNNSLAGLVTNLSSPLGMTLDGGGNLYVADNDGVLKWNVANGALTTVVSSAAGYSPSSVALDAATNVYFSDYWITPAIRKWNAYDSNVTTLVSSGVSSPTGVAVDIAGNVYFADQGNNTVKEWLAANGRVVTLVASGLNLPQGVAVDGSGNVYFADTGHYAIKKWIAASNTVVVLLSSSQLATPPQGIAVDGAGNVYYSIYPGAIMELPNAWVNTHGFGENVSAGTDIRSVAQPNNINLLPPFAPASDSSWLTMTNAGNYMPAGLVAFSFTANTGTNAVNRTANITVLGKSVPVVQSGPNYVLASNVLTEPAAPGSDSVVLTVIPSAAWTAETGAPWLHLSAANQSGTGSTAVVFTYDANPWPTNRTGTLTIAGQTVTVTQALLVTPPTLTGLQLTAGGALQFSFTNNVAANFSVWATTNLTLPFTNWTLVGPVSNEGGGQFQFVTPPASNSLQEFYRVSSP